MKRFLFTLTAMLLFALSFGQRLAQVTLTNGGNSDIISFITEDAVIVNISKDGKIIDWGIDGSTGRYYNSPGRLEKYMGRVDYYTDNDNEAYRGKVKYIGRTSFTYYNKNENEFLVGKVKSIGTVLFDYYNAYDDEALKGKIKNAGIALGYYSSFENEAFKGKFKNIGNSVLTYYTSFDDKAYKGKIKSIDTQKFTYYSSFDRREYQGTMKGTYQSQYIINGVKYLLR